MYNLSTIDKNGKCRIIGLDSKNMTDASLSAVKYLDDDLVYFALFNIDEVEQEVEK